MDQELNTDPTAANNSDDEEYYREDDAFGSLTAVGPDEDVEEYEATQALLRPHAAAAAATEIGPSSPTGDDDRSVASSTGDISITVEGAVRKRRPSVHAPSLQGAAMNDNEDEDVVVIDDDDEDDEDNYAQAADSMAEPTQLHDSSISMDADDVSRTVSTRNKSSRGILVVTTTMVMMIPRNQMPIQEQQICRTATKQAMTCWNTMLMTMKMTPLTWSPAQSIHSLRPPCFRYMHVPVKIQPWNCQISIGTANNEFTTASKLSLQPLGRINGNAALALSSTTIPNLLCVPFATLNELRGTSLPAHP